MVIDEIVKLYPEDFVPFLKKIYQGCIHFLGSDWKNLVEQVFLQVPFVFNRNAYDVLVERNMLEINSIVGSEELKRASGVYSSFPVLKYDGKNYSIQEIKRIIVVSNFSVDSVNSISSFIHELGHALKAFQNEYQIEGNMLVRRSGFIEEKFLLTVQDGEVKREFISEKNMGLEEGLNCIFEEKMMQQFIEPNFKSNAYGGVSFVANILCDCFSLFDVFMEAELTKDDQSLRKFLGEEHYFSLKELCDKIYQLDLKRYQVAFNSEQLFQTTKKRDQLVLQDFLELYNKIKKDRNKEDEYARNSRS